MLPKTKIGADFLNIPRLFSDPLDFNSGLLKANPISLFIFRTESNLDITLKLLLVIIVAYNYL